MKNPAFLIFALSGALIACQRSAPPESNPQPAQTAELPSVSTQDAVPTVPQTIPVLAYAEQTETITAEQEAPYAVSVTNTGSDASLRVVWQWLDGAGSPAGRPTTVESGVATGDGQLVRFDVRAPKEPGEHMLKVWLGRDSGESLEPQGSQPLHYRVQVTASK